MLASTPAQGEIFAGNRAIGRIALSVAAAADGSRRQRVHEAGALRVRFPNVTNKDTLEAVIVNTAGGMTGGDRFDIDVTVGAGARLTVTTAAAEKVYRSLGPDTADWREARRRSRRRARLAAAGDDPLRSNPAAAAPSRSSLRATRAFFWPKASSSAARPWVRLCSKGISSTAGGSASAERSALPKALRLDGAIAQRLAQRAVAGDALLLPASSSFPATTQAVAAVRAMEKDFAGRGRRLRLERPRRRAAGRARRRRASSRSHWRCDRIRWYAAAAIVVELKDD